MMRLCQTVREKRGRKRRREEGGGKWDSKRKNEHREATGARQRVIRSKCTQCGVYLHLGTITNLDNENGFNVQRVDVELKVGAVKKGDQMQGDVVA